MSGALDQRHSKSVSDLFLAVYSEFDFIKSLRWRNSKESREFMQKFSKVKMKKKGKEGKEELVYV